MSSRFCDRRTVLRFGGTALATIGTAGCLGGRSSAPRSVTMTDAFGFTPRTSKIEAGQTVTWTNTSDIGHTITAYEDDIPDRSPYFASGGFESERTARQHVTDGLIAPGGDYEHAFTVPGTYEYYCVPHESSGMVGTVRVE